MRLFFCTNWLYKDEEGEPSSTGRPSSHVSLSSLLAWLVATSSSSSSPVDNNLDDVMPQYIPGLVAARTM